MNWVDFVLIAVVVVGALMGMRIGLIKAALTAVGLVIGWALAGQLSDKIGGIFGDSLSNDTLVTVITYGIIVVGALIAASIAARVIKPLLTVFTLGLSSLVDRLGGLALGLLIGLVISGALIVGAARLTYDFDPESIVGENVPAQVLDQVTDQLARVVEAREGLETELTDSQLVSLFVDITDALPASALGFVPSDFGLALDILEASMD